MEYITVLAKVKLLLKSVMYMGSTHFVITIYWSCDVITPDPKIDMIKMNMSRNSLNKSNIAKSNLLLKNTEITKSCIIEFEI